MLFFALTGFRAQVMHTAQQNLANREGVMEIIVDESSSKFPLVRDFSRRSAMIEMFALAVKKTSEAILPEHVIWVTDRYTARFLSGMFIAFYIVVKSPAVFDNTLSLGVFLATLSIFGTYGDTITEINDKVSTIIDAFVPLKEYTEYLNLPKDLDMRKRLVDIRISETQKRRESIRNSVTTLEELQSVSFRSDSIQITAKDLTFEYTPGQPVLQHVNIAVAQGQTVAVTGPYKSGKFTLMQLLCNIHLPSQGIIFVPSHLQILHVVVMPCS
jgi:ABC-type multidrug transport system fused ATPase/permease subunit